MPAGRKLRVFLCHASQDKPVVRELYQRLLAEDWIDPWLDEEKLLPGQDWDLEIEKAVETADVVIACLSTNSVTKEGYVQKELRFVLDISDEKPDGTIFVIPLRFDDCPVPKRLKKWHYVDYFPKERCNLAYKKLLESFRLRAANLDITAVSRLSPSNEEIYFNLLGKEFKSPRDFLTSHIFCQVSHKQGWEFLADLLDTNHSGFSANYLESEEIQETSGKPFKEVANSNHLILTVSLQDIPQIPDNFWQRMPCDKETLVKLLEERKLVFGVRAFNDFYILMVAATSNEALTRAITRFLELEFIPDK